MATKKNLEPKITQILALSGPQSGQAVGDTIGGTVLLIKGTNFGEGPSFMHVLFDEISVPVLPILFSNDTLAVQAPIPPVPTNTISLLAGELSRAEPIDFHLAPGINPEFAGAAIVDLYNMMDAYAYLLGRTALVAPISPARRLLMDVSVNYLDGARVGARQSMNMLMQWQQYQPEITHAPIRTLEFTDSLIRDGGLVQNVVSMIDLTTGVTGWLGPVIERTGVGDFVDGLIDEATGLFDDIVDNIRSIFGAASDFIEEHTKLFDGIENGLKVATPSLSAEIGVGVDVSFSSGEAFSAVVRGIDAIGQIFGQDIPEPPDPLQEIKDAINKLEAKADTQEAVLSGISEDLAKQEGKADRGAEQLSEILDHLGKLEEKTDIIETKLDRSEEKQDRQEEKLDIIETKMDRQEEKLDRQEEKLDIIETKMDRQEEKLDVLEAKMDRQEEKLDRQEEKLDVLEAKADRQEGKLDRLEEKADKQEEKLDKLEGKADRQEGKLDRIEEKLDKQEKKLDKLEGKADRQEGKLDKLEGKADRQERKLDRQELKLDRLEKKADIQEKKLDKIEAKLDRLRASSPASDSSIANQRDGDDEISVAVAAIKEQDNKVYMKFAINIDQGRLNQPSAYTDWIDFERPAIAARLVAASIDLQYEDESDRTINALLTVRAEDGTIYQRSLEESNHQNLKRPNKWTDWNAFLGTP